MVYKLSSKSGMGQILSKLLIIVQLNNLQMRKRTAVPIRVMSKVSLHGDHQMLSGGFNAILVSCEMVPAFFRSAPACFVFVSFNVCLAIERS